MSVASHFHDLADRLLDGLLAVDPVAATWLGDHRFDGLLTDRSDAATTTTLAYLDSALTEVDAVDDLALDVGDRVDLEILRSSLLRWRFELGEVRRHEWDPVGWNPGTALYLLVSRDFAPADERASSLRSRLGAVPDLLATARGTLRDMPRVHVETAIAQLDGTVALLTGPVRGLAGDDPAVDVAVAAVAEFRGWLEDRVTESDRDPRLGARLYDGVLWHSLEDEVSASELLVAAQSRLDELTDEMVDLARRLTGRSAGSDESGVVRQALDDIAGAAPVTDRTVLGHVEAALARTTAFVHDRGIVSDPGLDVQVITMPEIHRGSAVAYCDAPGPLEPVELPTLVAVAPTPAGWTPDRVASFYREYNAVALHGLTVHEAMPGHVLQLARSAQCARPTRIRAAARSGTFVEGWAVYAEHVLAAAGYAPDDGPRSGAQFALVQRKTALRACINTILDISVHAQDMSESEAMALMCGRGFQEEGEAVGKWRRMLLTAGQLPTYFAGYRAVTSIVDDLRVLHPEWTDGQVHDLVLDHGSPGPRHLRTLLGL